MSKLFDDNHKEITDENIDENLGLVTEYLINIFKEERRFVTRHDTPTTMINEEGNCQECGKLQKPRTKVYLRPVNKNSRLNKIVCVACHELTKRFPHLLLPHKLHARS
jgi:hypothetical protein